MSVSTLHAVCVLKVSQGLFHPTAKGVAWSPLGRAPGAAPVLLRERKWEVSFLLAVSLLGKRLPASDITATLGPVSACGRAPTAALLERASWPPAAGLCCVCTTLSSRGRLSELFSIARERGIRSD